MLDGLKKATVWLSVAALAAGVAQTPVRAQEQEVARKVLTKVAPVYPSLARKTQLTGTVKMTVLVSPEGTVKSVKVLGGNALFLAAAQEAVKQWKYEAAKQETTHVVALNFEAPR